MTESVEGKKALVEQSKTVVPRFAIVKVMIQGTIGTEGKQAWLATHVPSGGAISVLASHRICYPQPIPCLLNSCPGGEIEYLLPLIAGVHASLYFEIKTRAAARAVSNNRAIRP